MEASQRSRKHNTFAQHVVAYRGLRRTYFAIEQAKRAVEKAVFPGSRPKS